MRRACVVCVCLLGVMMPRVSDAITPEEQQAVLGALQEGKAAYTQGEYAQALGHYQRAIGIFESASIWYQIGLCHERLGQSVQAIEAYDTMLELEPGHPGAGKATASLKVLRERVAAKSIGTLLVTTTPASARLVINGEVAGSKRPAQRALSPGEVTLTVSAPGYVTSTREVLVRGGERLQLEVTLLREEPAEAPALPPVKAKPRPARAGSPWGPVFGLSGASLAVLGFGGRLVLESVWAPALACADRTGSCQTQQLSEVEGKVAITNALVVAGYVGLGLGVVGISWWALDAPMEASVSLHPSGVSVSGRF